MGVFFTNIKPAAAVASENFGAHASKIIKHYIGLTTDKSILPDLDKTLAVKSADISEAVQSYIEKNESVPAQGGAADIKSLKKFEPLRAGFFLGFVLLIVIAGLYAGANNIKDWSAGLLHLAEGLGGIATGLFIGEAKS